MFPKGRTGRRAGPPRPGIRARLCLSIPPLHHLLSPTDIHPAPVIHPSLHGMTTPLGQLADSRQRRRGGWRGREVQKEEEEEEEQEEEEEKEEDWEVVEEGEEEKKKEEEEEKKKEEKEEEEEVEEEEEEKKKKKKKKEQEEEEESLRQTAGGTWPPLPPSTTTEGMQTDRQAGVKDVVWIEASQSTADSQPCSCPLRQVLSTLQKEC
ncbi:unnamed protein product [Gadus morhua 'NCC']